VGKHWVRHGGSERDFGYHPRLSIVVVEAFYFCKNQQQKILFWRQNLNTVNAGTDRPTAAFWHISGKLVSRQILLRTDYIDCMFSHHNNLMKGDESALILIKPVHLISAFFDSMDNDEHFLFLFQVC
jgi:hypothetical protein